MRKFLFSFIWLVCCLQFSFGQGSEIDSLRQVLEQTTVDSAKARVAIWIAETLHKTDLEASVEYAEKAIKWTTNCDCKKLEAEAIQMLASANMYAGKYLVTEKKGKLLLKMAEENGWKKLEAAANLILGNTFNYLQRLEESIAHFEKAAAANEALKDTAEWGNVYNGISAIYNATGDYKKSERFLLKAKDLLEAINDKRYLPTVYGNLSFVYDAEPEKALEYCNQSIKLLQEQGNLYALALTVQNASYYYAALGQTEKAMEYDRWSLYLSKKLGIETSILIAYLNIGDAHKRNDQLDSASFYYQLALESMNENTPIEYRLDTHESLSRFYATKGDFKIAYEQLRISVAWTDSLNKVKNMAQIEEFDAKYRASESEKELANKELEIANQKITQNRLLIGGFLLLLLASAIYFWYYINQSRKKRAAELALELQQKEATQLRALDQIKSNFFANISHEFRTPLTLIISPLQEMVSGTFTGNAASYFKMMLRNGKRLLNLVNQLLDLSRLEAGKMKLEASPFEVATFVKPIANAFESLAARKQIDYQITFEKGKMEAWLDEDKFEKVLTNLLSNAFKFTPEEGSIKLLVEKKGATFNIKIEDSGIGIPESDLPHIFDRFYQVNSASDREFEGSGIGLALTQELVQLHGGSIFVESEEGKGSTFIVQMPLGKAHLKPEELSAKKEIIQKEISIPDNIGAAATKKSKAKIFDSKKEVLLVVEDNEDVRQYICDKLKDNYELIEATDGEAGLENAKAQIPDLIITDLMMPKMDGMELTKALKTNVQTSHIPVIMLTARADMDDKLEGLEMGADDYLTKPFDNRELEVRVSNLIQQRKVLIEKFSQGISNLSKPVSGSKIDELFLEKLLKIVEANMEDEEFGVEELSKAVHLSRYQLHRKIKALTGKSISVFIRTVRLRHAKTLLENGEGNVSEIAFRLGFNSVAYFSKCFSEEFGVVPSKL